jgi:SAM-dependent methyltransferase
VSEPGGYTPQPLGERARRLAREQGIVPVSRRLGRWGAEALVGLPWALRGAHGEFELGGERYAYLFDRHKHTWLTERTVEVPVIGALVDRHRGGRVLEVGNVLGHYRDGQHLVVDKYEPAPGVLNRDVLELDDLGQFDLIVAVSTLEHVGWDEQPRDPSKAVRALQALRAMLAPGGRLELTVPAGYNPSFDAALRASPVEYSGAMRRAGSGASWREVTSDAAWSAPYDFLLYRARGVLFVSVRR